MITGVFGLPGAGKSSFLAYAAQKAVKGKPVYIGFPPFWRVPLGCEYPYKRVYSNFPIAGCYELKWEMLGYVDFSDCLILIDEIMHLCDSRDWKNFDAAKKYWFSMSRHYRSDVCFCSQSYDDCDRKIRNLTAQYLYIQNCGAWSRISPIAKSWAFDKNIEERFQQLPPIQCTYIYRRKYYHLFDSYTAQKMPENPALLWEVPQREKKKRKLVLPFVRP